MLLTNICLSNTECSEGWMMLLFLSTLNHIFTSHPTLPCMHRKFYSKYENSSSTLTLCTPLNTLDANLLTNPRPKPFTLKASTIQLQQLSNSTKYFFSKSFNLKQHHHLVKCFVYSRISMETASMGGLAGFQYIAPNHIVKTSLQ